MSEIVVQRVDRKRIPLEQRSAFSVAAEALARELPTIADEGRAEVIVLNTCERFEVYYAADNWRVMLRLQTEITFGSAMRESGERAIRHLFRVAAGVESRIPGEAQVLGQVRTALNNATSRNSVRGAVADAFTYAIRCGRRVRERTPLGHIDSSYVQKTVDCLSTTLDNVQHAQIIVAGSGALSTEIAVALRAIGARNLTIVGRHEGRLAASAHTANASWLTFDELARSSSVIDAIVSAVSTSHPVITRHLLGSRRPRVVVDLGAAPNVSSDLDALPGVRVVRLDDLGGGDTTAAAIAQAEALVEREVARYVATRHSTLWSRDVVDEGVAHGI